MLPCVDGAPVVGIVPRPWAELPAIAPTAIEEVEPVAAEEMELDVSVWAGVASSLMAIILSINSRWAAVALAPPLYGYLPWEYSHLVSHCYSCRCLRPIHLHY